MLQTFSESIHKYYRRIQTHRIFSNFDILKSFGISTILRGGFGLILNFRLFLGIQRLKISQLMKKRKNLKETNFCILRLVVYGFLGKLKHMVISYILYLTFLFSQLAVFYRNSYIFGLKMHDTIPTLNGHKLRNIRS